MVNDVSRDGEATLNDIVFFVAAKPSWSSSSLSVVVADPLCIAGQGCELHRPTAAHRRAVRGGEIA